MAQEGDIEADAILRRLRLPAEAAPLAALQVAQMARASELDQAAGRHLAGLDAARIGARFVGSAVSWRRGFGFALGHRAPRATRTVRRTIASRLGSSQWNAGFQARHPRALT